MCCLRLWDVNEAETQSFVLDPTQDIWPLVEQGTRIVASDTMRVTTVLCHFARGVDLGRSARCGDGDGDDDGDGDGGGGGGGSDWDAPTTLFLLDAQVRENVRSPPRTFPL